MFAKSFTVVSDGRDLKSLVSSLEQRGRVIEIHLEEDLGKKEISSQIIITKGKRYHLVGISGDEFTEKDPWGRRFNLSRNEIMEKASRRGYRNPPAEVAFLLREKFSQQELGYHYVEIMHDPIIKREPARDTDHQMSLVVDCYDHLDFLHTYYGKPYYMVCKYDLFLFLAPEKSKN